MTPLVESRADVLPFLGSLRIYDKRHDGKVAQSLLTALSINVDPGPDDHWQGADIPLRHTLSLLDSKERAARVSSVNVAMESLGESERSVLAQALLGAGVCPPKELR
jgi:hypothetical protein